MFVQAIDNILYQNPVLYGEDWTIRLTDDDFDLAIKETSAKMLVKSARVKAVRLLKKLGIKARLEKDGGKWNYCLFGSPATLRPGFCFTITELLWKIPIPQICNTTIKYPSASCDYLAWELPFTREEINDYIDNKAYHPILTSFFVGIVNDPTKHRRKILAQLKKQIKNQNNDTIILTRNPPHGMPTLRKRD